ncbi:MAG TPA: hypothetical protein VF590_18745 [Isosphaeraceae bacterium]|jgi:hypothetical protein
MNGMVTVICLANSRKPPSGRCIAGKEKAGDGYGRWIRPVSMRPTHEISEEERRFEDGSLPELLEVIEVPIMGPTPVGHQIENMLIDARYYWEKVGTSTWGGLRPILDRPATLWTNGNSTYHGHNDRVGPTDAATLKGSLLLILPDDLQIRVSAESQYEGPPRRRVRAMFRYNGDHYSLIVTDPIVEQTLLARPDADYNVADAYLTISLKAS